MLRASALLIAWSLLEIGLDVQTSGGADVRCGESIHPGARQIESYIRIRREICVEPTFFGRVE